MSYKRNLGRFIWLPRLLSIAIALFFMLFSLDVFDIEGSLIEKTGAFVINSLPSLTMLAAVIITWRYPLIAGLLFTAAGIFIVGAEVIYALIINPSAVMSSRVFIFTPLIIIGVLFIISHKTAAKPRWFG